MPTVRNPQCFRIAVTSPPASLRWFCWNLPCSHEVQKLALASTRSSVSWKCLLGNTGRLLALLDGHRGKAPLSLFSFFFLPQLTCSGAGGTQAAAVPPGRDPSRDRDRCGRAPSPRAGGAHGVNFSRRRKMTVRSGVGRQPWSRGSGASRPRRPGVGARGAALPVSRRGSDNFDCGGAGPRRWRHSGPAEPHQPRAGSGLARSGGTARPRARPRPFPGLREAPGSVGQGPPSGTRSGARAAAELRRPRGECGPRGGGRRGRGRLRRGELRGGEPHAGPPNAESGLRPRPPLRPPVRAGSPFVVRSRRSGCSAALRVGAAAVPRDFKLYRRSRAPFLGRPGPLAAPPAASRTGGPSARRCAPLRPLRVPALAPLSPAGLAVSSGRPAPGGARSGAAAEGGLRERRRRSVERGLRGAPRCRRGYVAVGPPARRLGAAGRGAGGERRRAEPPPSSFVRALLLAKGAGRPRPRPGAWNLSLCVCYDLLHFSCPSNNEPFAILGKLVFPSLFVFCRGNKWKSGKSFWIRLKV